MRQSTVQPQQNKKMLKDDSSGGPDCGNGETGKTVSQERIRSPQISKRKFDSMSPTTVTAVQVLESKTNMPSKTFMSQQDKSNTNDIRCASRKRFKNVEDSLVPRQGSRLISRHLMLQEALLAHGVYHDNFQYIEKLGEGISGQILLCKHYPSSIKVAVKMVKKSKGHSLQEIRAHSTMTGSPRVVPLLAHFETVNHNVLVMPYYPKGDLYHYIADKIVGSACALHMKEVDRTSAKIIKRICLAIKSVHDKGYAHFDVKPENFLCSGDLSGSTKRESLWICDFGYSLQCTDAYPISDRVARGSGGYISPECTRGVSCGPASDIWSIGSIAHVLLTGHVPFAYELDLALQQYDEKALPLALKDESSFNLTIRAKDFLKATLHYNRKHRLNIEECLNHPWLWSG